MFGQNKISGPRGPRDYLVKEIFYTIQGEGPWAGIPSIFLRFSDCNLACHFCDTDFTGGTEYTLSGLMEALGRVRAATHSWPHHIVITGGEPMLQDLPPLLRLLREAHFKVQIETAGTLIPENTTDEDMAAVLIVCSPKTPKVHPFFVANTDAWKYIIKAGDTSLEDGLPIWSTQRPEHTGRVYRPSPMRKDRIFVQPCDENDPYRNARNIATATEIAMKYGYRLSLQMHKIAGLP